MFLSIFVGFSGDLLHNLETLICTEVLIYGPIGMKFGWQGQFYDRMFLKY